MYDQITIKVRMMHNYSTFLIGTSLKHTCVWTDQFIHSPQATFELVVYSLINPDRFYMTVYVNCLIYSLRIRNVFLI